MKLLFLLYFGPMGLLSDKIVNQVCTWPFSEKFFSPRNFGGPNTNKKLNALFSGSKRYFSQISGLMPIELSSTLSGYSLDNNYFIRSFTGKFLTFCWNSLMKIFSENLFNFFEIRLFIHSKEFKQFHSQAHHFENAYCNEYRSKKVKKLLNVVFGNFWQKINSSNGVIWLSVSFRH